MTTESVTGARELPRQGRNGKLASASTTGPVRVSVLGNSCALQVCTRRLEPGDMPYAELLRDLLARDGWPAEVTNYSTWMGTARGAVRDWPVAVWAAWPDLVVIQHGINEARSLILPPFLHRMAWTFDRSDRRAESRLVGHLQGAWPKLGRLASRFDRDAIPGHVSPARFGQQISRLVGQTVAHTQAVCVVVDLNPANDSLTRLGGAYAARRERLERELEQVVSSRAGVGMVRLEEVQAEIGGSKATFPDGIHLSPLAHRLVARRIADLYGELRRRG